MLREQIRLFHLFQVETDTRSRWTKLKQGSWRLQRRILSWSSGCRDCRSGWRSRQFFTWRRGPGCTKVKAECQNERALASRLVDQPSEENANRCNCQCSTAHLSDAREVQVKNHLHLRRTKKALRLFGSVRCFLHAWQPLLTSYIMLTVVYFLNLDFGKSTLSNIGSSPDIQGGGAQALMGPFFWMLLMHSQLGVRL